MTTCQRSKPLLLSVSTKLVGVFVSMFCLVSWLLFSVEITWILVFKLIVKLKEHGLEWGKNLEERASATTLGLCQALHYVTDRVLGGLFAIFCYFYETFRIQMLYKDFHFVGGVLLI